MQVRKTNSPAEPTSAGRAITLDWKFRAYAARYITYVAAKAKAFVGTARDLAKVGLI